MGKEGRKYTIKGRNPAPNGNFLFLNIHSIFPDVVKIMMK